MKTGFALLIVFVSMVGETLAADNDRPNIIMMMCDDLGYGDVGFNGNPHVKTPHLDRLATDGANLTHFYSIGPVCSPSRGSFLTGRHHYRMGIYTANRAHLPKEENTIAKLLKSKETYGKSDNRLTGNSGGFTGGKRDMHEGHAGEEYGTDFKPVEPWHALGELSRKGKKKVKEGL